MFHESYYIILLFSQWSNISVVKHGDSTAFPTTPTILAGDVWSVYHKKTERSWIVKKCIIILNVKLKSIYLPLSANYSLSHWHSPSHTHTITHKQTLSLSHTYTHTHKQTLSLLHIQPHTHTHKLSISHTHSHNITQTHTRVMTFSCIVISSQG